MELTEMSDEELWELFPIIICKYDPSWAHEYIKEKEKLTEVIGIGNIIRIDHIGSTAVPGLMAKPTIDILIQIIDNMYLDDLLSIMSDSDYIYVNQPNSPPPHMVFYKGYTPEGFKGQVFHVHIRYKGDWDELLFIDYLRANPETAKQYGDLKLSLEKKYKHDRDGYTVAKTDFIKDIIARAKRITE